MKLNILTNARPTQDLGAVLVAGVTDGQIKISVEFGKLIGLVNGNYMAIGQDTDDNIFAFAGNDDVAGNKLAKSGNYLQMSSKNVWNTLGGNTDNNRVFVVDGEVVEEDGVLYAKIIFDREEAKVERKASDPADEGTAVDPPADTEEVEEVEEV